MRNAFSKNLFLALLSLSVLAFAAGCDDDDDNLVDDGDDGDGTEVTASLRVVHAAPQAGVVDVFVEDEEVLSDVAYSATATVSEFLDVPLVEGEDVDVEVRPDGAAEAVIDASLDLEEDEDYTLIAAGQVPELAGILLDEDLSAPEAGNAKVRLVHGASTVGPVDIYVTGFTDDDEDGQDDSDELPDDPTFEDVAFTESTGYTALAAGDYRVRITAAGDDEVVIDTQALLNGPLGLTDAGIFTAIAVDPAEADGTPSVLLIAE